MITQTEIERLAAEAVSEIQRCLKSRNYVLIDFRGRREPVMTTEEMKKIVVNTFVYGVANPEAYGVPE